MFRVNIITTISPQQTSVKKLDHVKVYSLTVVNAEIVEFVKLYEITYILNNTGS